MSIGKTIFRLSLALLLMMGLAMPAFADSDSDSDSDSDGGPPKIVGSWEGVSILEPDGVESPGLFTFNIDRTWMSSGDSPLFSNAHGAWKQTGPRTFVTTNKAFVLAETGGVSLVLSNQTVIEVSADCQSFTGVFSSEISLPDGTVVDSFNGTATGTRITVH